ncbi:MAG: hypothetical protein UV36_C0004G0014 [Parcubacteria group bacterium GW2011_GWC2_42_6]|nr:MAG: hypothetical protein UU87_C0003G0118 [Parcubacteria group bacterium GW2011_GWA2_42_11]KKS67689.1 MAG: hypothetical protein UV36_C0004G0014 [Parcubacteria group bacterium GW2011_GWC2_42_6]KKT76446.1 MAG: hypothetical protein UW72_C0005G0014 [Parcubacteria group bacterium GW2011_GWF2_44_7]
MLITVGEETETLRGVATKASPLDFIKVERVVDTEETGNKFRYQTAEVLIYFGWPALVAWLVWIFSGNLLLTFLTGGLLFFWPYLKGIIGGFIANSRGIKDPRHGIRSSSFWFDGFLFIGSPILREIRKYSALSRSLDVIYNAFERFDGIRPRNFPDGKYGFWPISAWAKFWLGMPVAQDVRTRLDIIAEEYRKMIGNLASVQPGRTIRILEVAGGQLQAVVMGISRAEKDGAIFNYQVVSIEPEEDFSVPRALELIDKFNLNQECFTLIPSGISTKKEDRYIKNILAENQLDMAAFDIVVCIGLADYYYTQQRVIDLLRHFDGGLKHKVITANISDNFVERRLLHRLIQWPKMRYRSVVEWKGILLGAFGKRPIKIIQTPHGIFNIAVIE